MNLISKAIFVWPQRINYFVKICRKKVGRLVYAKQRSKFFKMSIFIDHYCSNEHRMFVWNSYNGMKSWIFFFNGQRACNEALYILFKATYFTRE